MTHQVPIVGYLVLGEQPHLQANRCVKCDALYFDRRNACAACGNGQFQPEALANTGVLSAFTIVHRASPSVPTPYVSAVIALDGGGVVKANLVGVDADPEAIHTVDKVELTTWVAGTDDDGTEAVAFGYKPIGAML